jgi:acetylornithine deacetylase
MLTSSRVHVVQIARKSSSRLTASEAEVVEAVAARRGELVELVRALVGFDTQTHHVDEPRQEAALQQYLSSRLTNAGFSVDIWEPERGSLPADRLKLGPNFHFDGRPQLLARLSGSGDGRSLLFNGHVDTVGVEPREAWTVDPLAGEVHDGRLYGRGACDMKGGVGAMVLAAETLLQAGVLLRGDLLVNTVTDEESTAAGAVASVLRGARADGCVVTEPTGLQAWLGTRGSLMPTITVRGRGGHAGLRQPHFASGGAVNAIEKMQFVLAGIERLRADWGRRYEHPHLDPPDVVPVAVSAGEWMVTQPGSCMLRCHLQYLPVQADDDGWGSSVEQEFESWLTRCAAADPWLCDHPPEVIWDADVPTSYVAPTEPVAAAILQVADDLGLVGGISPHTTWFDGATLARNGTPAIAFGPGDIARAHAVDEYVPIDDLVAAAQVLAVTAMRQCGVR